MEGSIHIKEKDLSKSRSVGCPWKAVSVMFKVWHYRKIDILVLEVTNLIRGLEGTIKL